MKPERKLKYSEWGVYIVIGLLIVLLYMALYPFKVSEVHSFRVLNSPAKRGDIMKMEINYSKYREVGVAGSRTIECEDGNLVTLTGMSLNLPVGKNITRTFDGPVLPEKTSLGWCTYNVNLTYHINAFNERTELFSSEPFLVVE